MAKICIMTTVHRRDDTRILSREGRSLARVYDVILLTADGLPEETIDGVRIRSVVTEKPRSRPERMLRTASIMFRAALAEDADAYHFHDPELLGVGMRLKRRGKTVVYDVHESISDTITDRDYLPAAMLRGLARAAGWADRNGARKMDAVVTVTPFLKERYDSWGCRTALVCNFPSLEDFPPPEDGAPREISMCCAGARVDYSRGIVEMLEASRRTGVPLHLFGKMHDAMERETAQRGGEGLVHTYGFVPPETVRRQMYSSLIGMVVEYPTGNAVNAYCVKLFEYMAAGLAVVSSDIPLWREIVEGADCGICVDPNDLDAVVEAVRRLAADPEEARRLGRNGRRWAEKQYNWAREEEKLLALYRELIE
ncbi:MAG: glycosyltransferase [Oscillospiraceae bacterium]|nr:glycosyltransferase [Oscillospiraceae bacterium]